ncbi:MAG: hypothetical protein SFV81_04310 [Pirellulaceae bacterium]|nr:hypothetical protein [Pirellulaceae bacterium]
MRNWFENTVAVVTVSVLAGLAIAQQQRSAPKMPTNVPVNSKFCIQIDLKAIKQTKLGAMLFSLAKQKAIEELGKEGGDEAGLAKLKEMLGMDPFEEIQSITLSSAEFEDPEKSMLAMVQLKKTAGNLEGLALGLPEYQSSEYKETQIHSAAPDKKMRVYGAIHGKEDQNRTIVLSPNKSSIETALDALNSNSGKAADEEKSPLVRLQLFEIPQDKIGEGPQANIAKIVKTMLLEVEDADEDIAFTAKMTTDTEKQAEQVRQMAQGVIAMIDFAQSMDSEDEDLKKIREMLVGLKATREGSDVQVGLTLNAAKIASALAEELHLDLKLEVAKSEEVKQLEAAQQALAKAQLEVERLKREVEETTKATKKLIEKTK